MTETAVLIIIVEQVWEAPGGARPFGPNPRIVVPLDGGETSRAALAPALALARRTGARLELVTTRVPEDELTSPTSFLDEIAAGLDGVASTTTVRMERDPVDAIAAVVAEGDGPTLIVMSTHGRGRARRAVLGSTAELVVAGGSAPVMMIGPEFEVDRFAPDQAVLVAYDAEHEPDADLITGLAHSAGGNAVILEVAFSATGSTFHNQPAPAASEAALAFAEALRERGVAVSCEGRYGANTHKVIVDRAVELDASYVAVTTRARTGARRIALGSVAAAVVSSSPMPVLVSRSA